MPLTSLGAREVVRAIDCDEEGDEIVIELANIEAPIKVDAVVAMLDEALLVRRVPIVRFVGADAATSDHIIASARALRVVDRVRLGEAH